MLECHSVSCSLRYSRSLRKAARPWGGLGKETLRRGRQISLRRVEGRVFLPAKGSWLRAALFWDGQFGGLMV